MRRLLDGEVAILSSRFGGSVLPKNSVFSSGLDLINIALMADSQDVLQLLLPTDAMAAAPPPDPRQQQQELWFEACKACQLSDIESVRRFLSAGGSPSRRLLGSEARELCRYMPDCFCEGETLANLALKWDNTAVLNLVLEAAEARTDSGGDHADGGKEMADASSGSRGGGMADFSKCHESAIASSSHDTVSNMREESGCRHGLDIIAQDGFCDSMVPYIAADNGTARHVDASRLGMQGMWLQACRAAYSDTSNPIMSFVEAGGDVNRRLTDSEVESLRGYGCFKVGDRLAEIALRRDSGQALACIVSGDLSSGADFDLSPPLKRRAIMEDYGAADMDLSTGCGGAEGSGDKEEGWDHVWLDAILGVVAGQDDKVLAYIEGGGKLNRRLSAREMSLLLDDNSGLITPGKLAARDTLVDLCLRFERQEVLKALCPNEVPQGAIKRLPSHQFPHEASGISREVSAGLETVRTGRCDARASAYLQLNFAVPCEIRSFSDDVRRAILTEIVDVDARQTLEDPREPVINWSPTLQAHSRLYPLYNGGLGDCLLHSTLQAAAGVEEPVQALRASLCAMMKSADLYPRWRESRAREALHDGFRADEWQWRKEWADLVRSSSTPKASLEQTHVWVLAHVMRRPIIVYAIHHIRNYRDEVVGLARHQGIYLPSMLDRRDCSSNPIALAYVRGHYLGLVGEETEQGSGTTVLLPVTTPENKLLPVHFVSDSERGNEAAIVREWFCCRQVDGVLCVEQHTPARADRPQACQALVKRYAENLEARFLSKPVHGVGTGGGEVAGPLSLSGNAVDVGVGVMGCVQGGGSPARGWTTFDQDS